MIVLDASAAIEWLLQTSKAAAIEERLYSMAAHSRAWYVPHLLDVEVAQVLRKQVAAGTLTARRAGEAVEDLMAMPLVRYPHDLLLPRIWELRGNLTAYDAAYVALAEALEASLVTCDRHVATAPGHHAHVDVI